MARLSEFILQAFTNCQYGQVTSCSYAKGNYQRCG